MEAYASPYNYGIDTDDLVIDAKFLLESFQAALKVTTSLYREILDNLDSEVEALNHATPVISAVPHVSLSTSYCGAPTFTASHY